MSYPKKEKKKKKNLRSNIGLPRITMKGQINPLTRVLKVAKKVKFYD